MLAQASLLGEDDLMDRSDRFVVAEGRSGSRGCPSGAGIRPVGMQWSGRLEAPNLLVIRLRAPPQHGGQGESRGPQIPSPDAGTLVRLHGNELTLVREEDLGAAVQIEVESPPIVSGLFREREILGGDQVAVIREPQ